MTNLSRILRYGKYAGAAGITLGAGYVLKNNDWDVSTLGLVRFGRTAVNIGIIAVDYKISLRGVSNEDADCNLKWSTVHSRSAERLLKLCSTNGGVFIKVGQHIATLDYIVPPEYCSVLKVLQSHAPQSSVDEIKQIIASDLGSEPEEMFAHFDIVPLGAASLAQVHKAVLKETGETVAVKVQHPLVKKHSFVDMATMDILIRGVSKIFPEFSFLWLADETKKNLPLELDFMNEGRNAERVQKMFSSLSWLKIPSIRWKYCSPRILTMEFVEGGEVTNKAYVEKNKLDPREISNRLSTLYSEMIFIQGFVHCDPHPGNILVRQSPQGPEIVLLDHGLYTVLPEKFRHNYSHMWLAVLNADVPNLKKYGQELGAGDMFPLLACMLASKSWESLVSGLTTVGTKANHKAEKEKLRKYAAQYFPQIVQVLSSVNREILLLLKTNDLLRGIENSLGTKGERRSLINMSRYCIRSVYEERLKECSNSVKRVALKVSREWQLFKLSFFQFYLWSWCLVMGPQYR
ncbi:AarF domain-containing protein kinase 1 [Halotydeus destructor]|nr:AarF domain-containing protein kinase 1 [Halotydeus destructor]